MACVHVDVHRARPRSISASSAAATSPGPFHQGHVSAIVEHHARRLRDARSVQRERARIDHRVLPAPQQQRGLPDAVASSPGRKRSAPRPMRSRTLLFEGGIVHAAARCTRVGGPGNARLGLVAMEDGGEVAVERGAIVHRERIPARRARRHRSGCRGIARPPHRAGPRARPVADSRRRPARRCRRPSSARPARPACLARPNG